MENIYIYISVCIKRLICRWHLAVFTCYSNLLYIYFLILNVAIWCNKCKYVNNRQRLEPPSVLEIWLYSTWGSQLKIKDVNHTWRVMTGVQMKCYYWSRAQESLQSVQDFAEGVFGVWRRFGCCSIVINKPWIFYVPKAPKLSPRNPIGDHCRAQHNDCKSTGEWMRTYFNFLITRRNM